MRSEVLETTGCDGVSLRVEFAWHVDRFRHVISAIEPSGTCIPLLESIEGSLADNWPPSPPLQSLHLETQPGGRRVALLVGMAGKSHWSASIVPAESGTGFEFDFACRASGPPGQIGTSYRFADGMRMAEVDANAVRLQRGSSVLIVETSIDQATRSELDVRGDGTLRIASHTQGSTVQPTRRWLYHVHLKTAGHR